MQFHICKKMGAGSIINTTSMAAFNGDLREPLMVPVRESCFFNQICSCSVWQTKYSLQCGAPGLIMTPAAIHHVPDFMKELFLKFNALPYHGEPNDIAYTVLFLASDESKFITGQTIEVEGGHYINNPTASDMVAFAQAQQ